jgi:N-acyl homoserine lactone hydrolase
MRTAAQAFKARVSLAATVLIAAATLGSVIAQSHPPKPPKTVRLYVFDCGVIKAMDPKLFNFEPGELANTEMSVPAFLIVDPKGTLIWDTGSIPDVDFKGDTTPITEGYFTATRTLRSQLAEIGYTPADITYLALSHYHGDHVANANEFSGSTWLVRKPAIATPKTYDKLKNSKTILITTDEYDVFGDGKVIIKSAPGHTPGHQVLVVKLAHTGNVMLSGDLYHYPEERKLNHVPSFEYNAQETLASRAMIETYLKKTHTQLWIEHDIAANAKLKKAPKYYN